MKIPFLASSKAFCGKHENMHTASRLYSQFIWLFHFNGSYAIVALCSFMSLSCGGWKKTILVHNKASMSFPFGVEGGNMITSCNWIERIEATQKKAWQQVSKYFWIYFKINKIKYKKLWNWIELLFTGVLKILKSNPFQFQFHWTFLG